MARARGHGRLSSTPVSDDFERASLGTNWSLFIGDATKTGIVASSDFGILAFSGVHIAAWNGPQPGANQYSEGRSSANMPAQIQWQIFCRRRTSDAARYALHFDPEGSNLWEIKYDGVPTVDTRILATSAVAAPVAGDVLRLEVRGAGASINLRAFHNAVQIMEAEDTNANRILSGPPGLVTREFVGRSSTYPIPVWEAWSAGTLLT